MAVVVLASYFISTRLSVTVGGVTASVSGVEVNDGNLRMMNPTLKGMDKKNGAYVVSADYADQDMKNPKMIKLHAIKAELTTDQKGWSRMQAVRGLFNSESERLDNAGRHPRLDQLRRHRQAHPCEPRNEEPGRCARTSRSLSTCRAAPCARARSRCNSADKTLLFRGKVRVRIIRAQNNRPTAGASEAPRPPKIEAPDAPARVPPEASAAVPAEPRHNEHALKTRIPFAGGVRRAARRRCGRALPARRDAGSGANHEQHLRRILQELE